MSFEMSTQKNPFVHILWLSLCILTVSLVACEGDLTVELSDEEKDDLAAYVENGGRTPGASSVPDIAPPESLVGVPTLTHATWDALLGVYVEEGRVDYTGFARAQDAGELADLYRTTLAEVDPFQLESSAERLAFWINAYNASTFVTVASNLRDDPTYRVDRDDFLVFKEVRHTVAGGVYSLDQLEHGVIRGDWEHSSMKDLTEEELAPFRAHHEAIFPDGVVDARIHVALNCAALSCPSLPSWAFTGEKLEDQLRERAELFAFDVERGAGPNGISRLFLWFAIDFDTGYGSARGFLEAHRDDLTGVDLNTFLEYDWALNGS